MQPVVRLCHAGCISEFIAGAQENDFVCPSDRFKFFCPSQVFLFKISHWKIKIQREDIWSTNFISKSNIAIKLWIIWIGCRDKENYNSLTNNVVSRIWGGGLRIAATGRQLHKRLTRKVGNTGLRISFLNRSRCLVGAHSVLYRYKIRVIGIYRQIFSNSLIIS